MKNIYFLSFTLLSFIIIFDLRASNYDIKDDAIIAKVANKNITYKQIKVNPKDLDIATIRQKEFYRLRRKMLKMIINNEIQNNNIVPSQKKIDKRIKAKLEKMYGKKSFNVVDAQEQNETASAMINLLEVWQNDQEEGEALYKDKFQDRITEKNWNRYKNIYASKERLDTLKRQMPTITPEAVNSKLKELAIKELEKKLLIAKLVELGKINDKHNFNDWLSNKLEECVILSDIIPLKANMRLNSTDTNAPKESILKPLTPIEN